MIGICLSVLALHCERSKIGRMWICLSAAKNWVGNLTKVFSKIFIKAIFNGDLKKENMIKIT